MGDDFFKAENHCAQSMLKLVSRGSAILAELQRLSSIIPKLFIEGTPESEKYKSILNDFKYWNQIDQMEDLIQQNQENVELDEYIRDTYLDLIERFFNLFQSIYLYYMDINQLIEEILEGTFVQYSFENILLNFEGRKLMVEMFYLYGVMLLLMDRLIPGPVREKLVVAYYRYKGSNQEIEHLNEVSKLTAKTGFLPAKNPLDSDTRPQYYPEEFFQRYKFDVSLIDQLVNSIKDDDIYKSQVAYPNPDHRSFALSTQGGMLYVLLFFNCDIMDQKKSKMREIVDRHFYDQWVIPFYLSYYVDLTIEWNEFKAARKALENTLDLDQIQDLTNAYVENLEKCYEQCEEYLIDGVLNEEFILEDKTKPLLQTLTLSNITIKWLMLHKRSKMKKIREIITKNLSDKAILSLLLISAKFENKLNTVFDNLIKTKQERWDEYKGACAEKMVELAEYFGGARAIVKVEQDENLKKWFLALKDSIEALSYGNSVHAGRKINQIIKALTDIEDYHQIQKNQPIKIYLSDCRKELKQMIRVSNIQESILTHISLVSDISYCWQIIPDFITIMQQKIQKHPEVALLLKPTFVKLSSILNTPMVRIIQAESNDIQSVSNYYSQELVKFVKKVLQIIPEQVFDVLENVIKLLSNSKDKLVPIPWKFKKEELKDLAQYEKRRKISDSIYRISLFTESILTMETYLVGVIEVNPKEILDEGIRKELIRLIFKVLDSHLTFKAGTIDDFMNRLLELANRLEGFKVSIEYIQDFIQTYGIKSFHEEFDKLINAYIDMEQYAFLTGNQDFEEIFYDEDIPMPNPKSPNHEPGTINFMGRLLKALQNLTDPKNTVYIDHALGFFELGTGKEIITMKTLGLLYRCIGVSGLNGLDKLLSYNITTMIKKICQQINKILTPPMKKQIKEIFTHEFKNLNAFSDTRDQTIANLKNILKNLIGQLLQPIQKIGQMILLRKVICLQLQIMSKVGSNRLYLCLENLNSGILNDMQNKNQSNNLSEEQIEKESSMLHASTQLFNFIGLSDPQKKIYYTPDQIEGLPIFFFILTIQAVPYIDFDTTINTLVKRQTKDKKNQVDILPSYFICGILSFLNQFHPNNKDIFMGLLAQHIKSAFNNNVHQQKDKEKNQESLADLLTTISFFDEFVKISGESGQQYLNPYLPVELINSFKRETN